MAGWKLNKKHSNSVQGRKGGEHDCHRHGRVFKIIGYILFDLFREMSLYNETI